MMGNVQKSTNNNISEKILLVIIKVKKQINNTTLAECIANSINKVVKLVNLQAKEGQVARVIEFDRITK